MGIYLFILAVKDVQYRHEYNIHAYAWTTSFLCSTIGILAMISSEVRKIGGDTKVYLCKSLVVIKSQVEFVGKPYKRSSKTGVVKKAIIIRGGKKRGKSGKSRGLM